MLRRGSIRWAVVGLFLVPWTTAAAQAVAEPAPKGAGDSVVSWLILFIPALFLPLVFLAMRRAGRMQPMMNRSLVMAEETLLLQREQVALQKETNRLLGLLVASRGETP